MIRWLLGTTIEWYGKNIQKRGLIKIQHNIKNRYKERKCLVVSCFFVQIALTHAKIRHVINQVGTACSDVRPDIGTIIAALHALKIA